MIHPRPSRPHLARLAGLAVLAVPLLLAAAVVPDRPARDGFTWSLDHLTVDGQRVPVTTGFTSLDADRFSNLVLIVEPVGEFTISDRPFPGSEPSGRFDGRLLEFEAAGHAVSIQAKGAYFDAPRQAHVRFLAPTTPSAYDGTRATFALALSLDRTPAARSSRSMFSSFAVRQPAADDARTVVLADLTGLVTDADSGAPLADAGLQIAGTPFAARTGTDGRYRMNAPPGEQTVLVSKSGYEARRIRLTDGQTELNVALTTQNVAPALSSERRARIDSMRALQPPVRTAGRDDVFDVVEQEPVLIGGLAELQRRVVYPPSARDEGVGGTVFVQFIVDEEGTPTEIQVVRTPDERLSEAAVAAIAASRFDAGRQRDRAVKVRYSLPIRFVLRSGED